MTSSTRINQNRLTVGNEVYLGIDEVVVLDFRTVRGSYAHGGALVQTSTREVYVEHENGDCEWVPRKALTLTINREG